MTAQERHAAAVAILRGLRKVCAKHPDRAAQRASGCLRCPLAEWCGTRSPESLTDEELEQIAEIAEQEVR